MIRWSITYASAIWANTGKTAPLKRLERWAFRCALNTFRNPDREHFISNKIIYELMDYEILTTFLQRTRERYELRIETHVNPNIHRVIGYECEW